MDMPKLLIVDNDEAFRLALCNMLKDRCILRSCATGRQALELLQNFRPDVLILDLFLPEIDGITLLQRANDAGLHPAVLALTSFQSNYISASATKLGVHYMLSKPCDVRAIAAHALDMASEVEPAPAPELDLYSAVTDQLLSMSLSVKHDGFGYLQIAIPLFAEDMSQAVTKILYPAVAKHFNKDPRQVERSIRTAITVAWNKKDSHAWQQYFPTAPDGSVPRPTNKTFISHLADALNRQMHCWYSA